MGAPEGAKEEIGEEREAGGVVWVRRRNGSWWPGRILGQEELAAVQLMSPRSGTPVKLLGREDASVDWYNLEKSKRVKPFRCGEFDACIERAEASQGIPTKKREKYARREDAILHALELEKQHLEKQRQKNGINSNNFSNRFSGIMKKITNSGSPSGLHLRDDELMDHSEPVNSELQPQSMRADLFFEELSEDMHLEKGKHSEKMKFNDENSAALPHPEGLLDFDFHMSPSQRKEPNSAPCEGSQTVLFNYHVDVILDSGNGIDGVNDIGGVKTMGVKRKRLHGTLVEESLVRNHDRQCPLIQAVENSIKLPAKSLQGNFKQNSNLQKEKKEQIGAACRAKRSRCIYLPANKSDCIDHTGCTSDQMQMSPTESGYSNGLQPSGLLTEEDASSGLIGDCETSSSEGDYLVDDLDEETALHQDAGETRVSKWHMKGKRFNRNFMKKSMDVFDAKDSVVSSDNCSGSLSGPAEKKQYVFKSGWERLPGQGLYHKDKELNYVYDDDDFSGKDDWMIGFGKRSCPLTLKAASRNHINHGIDDSDEDSHKIFSSVWEANEPFQLVQKAYWEEIDAFLDARFIHPLNVDIASQLVDVNLKVQASYQGEHVPLVSLMSRLNGKAIIGHPVHIEILENSFTDFLYPRNHLGGNATAVDELAAPTAWRTGKRTAMQRVPRPHLAASSPRPESEFIPYSNGQGKPPFKKLYAAPPNWTCKKSSNHRKFHKRKKGSLPSQKTRILPSIETAKKCNYVNASAKHKRKEGSIFNGLTKSACRVPLITCVPVKVVFARMLEAVGRPPTVGVSHGAPVDSSLQRTRS